MEYFSVKPDPLQTFISIHTGNTKAIQAMLKNDKDSIPERASFEIRELSQYGIPDILFSPLILVSGLVYSCIRIYQPYIKAKQVFLHYQDRSIVYYILMIPAVKIKENVFDCLHHVYENVEKKELIVSLDLAESLLRRSAFGFMLEEIPYEQIQAGEGDTF